MLKCKHPECQNTPFILGLSGYCSVNCEHDHSTMRKLPEVNTNTPMPKTHDPVNNPKHYDLFADGTQSMDVIQSALSPEEFKGFLKGNCLKYRLRAGKKDKLQQDIDKANWYENKLREVIENETI